MKHPVVRELRAARRFAVNLPVSLSWRATDHERRQERGFTRDISTQGMLVLAQTGPAKGRLLEFVIDLALDGYSRLLQVKGEGRVVRVERPAADSECSGFAVVNLSFKLCQPEESNVQPVKAGPQASTVAPDAAGGPEGAPPKRSAVGWPSEPFPE